MKKQKFYFALFFYHSFAINRWRRTDTLHPKIKRRQGTSNQLSIMAVHKEVNFVAYLLIVLGKIFL